MDLRGVFNALLSVASKRCFFSASLNSSSRFHHGANLMAKVEDRYPQVPELEPFYMQTGKIASAWANLEFHIDRLLWDLSDAPQMLAACMTTQLTNAGARLRALIGMVRLREGSEQLIKKLNQFEGHTNVIIRKRNRAVHDVWHYNRFDGGAHQLMIAIEEKTLQFDFVRKDISNVLDTMT
jgi:hypothetical protein